MEWKSDINDRVNKTKYTMDPGIYYLMETNKYSTKST